MGVCRAKSKKEKAGAEREAPMFDCLRAIESRSREGGSARASRGGKAVAGVGRERERERAEVWVTNWKMVYGKKFRKPFSVFY